MPGGVVDDLHRAAILSGEAAVVRYAESQRDRVLLAARQSRVGAAVVGLAPEALWNLGQAQGAETPVERPALGSRGRDRLEILVNGIGPQRVLQLVAEPIRPSCRRVSA